MDTAVEPPRQGEYVLGLLMNDAMDDDNSDFGQHVGNASSSSSSPSSRSAPNQNNVSVSGMVDGTVTLPMRTQRGRGVGRSNPFLCP